ncbi:MAG UNVERIFIED_CONTAM: hypothetical protein LVR18_26395 [Planctomycetaceae bacterium]
MPDTAPEIKFRRTQAFGAEVRTYNIARDHETGERDAVYTADRRSGKRRAGLAL